MAPTLTVPMAVGLSQIVADKPAAHAQGICPGVDATTNKATLNAAAMLDMAVTA